MELVELYRLQSSNQKNSSLIIRGICLYYAFYIHASTHNFISDILYNFYTRSCDMLMLLQLKLIMITVYQITLVLIDQFIRGKTHPSTQIDPQYQTDMVEQSPLFLTYFQY